MPRSVLVLVFDGLTSAYLGPYGNGWVETPALNELSADSMLVEYAMTDSLDLLRTYESFWLGQHASAERGDDAVGLPRMCLQAGIPFAMFTDDPHIAGHRMLAGVDDVSLLQSGPPCAAMELDRTLTAEVCQLVATHLDSLAPGQVTWLHARALTGPWDAPWELRAALSDEEDDSPPDWIEPPTCKLDADFDPDELWGLSRAYAAQVMAVDFGVGLVMDALAGRDNLEETLVLLTSPRGYTLGEHGYVGCAGVPAFSESVIVPLLVRSHEHRMIRTPALCQPADLFATITAWLNLPTSKAEIGTDLLAMNPFEPSPAQQRAVSVLDEVLLLRTPGWLYRKLSNASGGQEQLFVKPDDRWDANEIADRCRDIVDLMREEAERYCDAVVTSQVAALDQLPAELLAPRHRRLE